MSDTLNHDKLMLLGQMAGTKAHEILNLLNSVPIRIESNLRKSDQTVAALGKIKDVLTGLRTELKDEGRDLAPSYEKKLALIDNIASVLAKDQESRTDDLSFILKQISRVINITGSIRSLSKTERIIEDVEMKSLLSEVIADSSDALARRGVEVTLDCPEALFMEADTTELYSIFFNLMKNSIEAFNNIKGDAVKAVFITAAQTDGGLIEIRFKDTGAGINPDKLEKIFEQGFTDKGRDGTGVGLALVRTLVRQYGGDCSVIASAPGVGTEFRLFMSPQSDKTG